MHRSEAEGRFGEAEPAVMTRPKVASQSEVARGLRSSVCARAQTIGVEFRAVTFRTRVYSWTRRETRATPNSANFPLAGSVPTFLFGHRLRQNRKWRESLPATNAKTSPPHPDGSSLSTFADAYYSKTDSRGASANSRHKNEPQNQWVKNRLGQAPVRQQKSSPLAGKREEKPARDFALRATTKKFQGRRDGETKGL